MFYVSYFMILPRSMQFSGQPNKWISAIFIIGLPFYVLYKFFKGEL